jgi:hypothetical protein
VAAPRRALPIRERENEIAPGEYIIGGSDPWPTSGAFRPPAPPPPPAAIREHVPERTVASERGVINARQGMHAAKIFAIGSSALVFAVLLNADQLLHEAETKPFGRDRDFWVAIWKPFAQVSDFTRLNRPRIWVDRALGHDDPGHGRSAGLPPPPGSVQEPASTATAATSTAVDATISPQTQTPQPTPVPTPPPRLVRHPTADDPLKMWIGGDSMAGVYGQSLVRAATDTGVISAELDYRVSSGLTRPDFFDWPAELADISEHEKPDIVVVMFGANDSQGIRTPDGKVFQATSEGWVAEYRRRVAEAMDELEATGRMVVWTGQPVMESADFSEKMATMNQIYMEEAAKRPWVVYLDSWSVFVDSHGNYNAYLPDGSGDELLMRAGDGVHLSRAGGDRLAAAAMAVVAKEAGLAP